MSNLSLEMLAALEPWRLGKGQPRNALDPTWNPSALDNPCDGDIAWEGTTEWWTCTKCGYVGRAYFTRHKPIENPGLYLLHSLLFYFVKRTQRPPRVAPEQAVLESLKQLAFVAGVAIRYAATQQPEDLGRYVDRLVVD